MAEKITNITAREILDSRGNPTLEVTVQAGHAYGTFAVPAGASKGSHEPVEKRDGGKRFNGLGARTAVSIVQGKIAERLKGMAVTDQQGVDKALLELDGTKDKSYLGGNSITGVSVALAKAAAIAVEQPVFMYLATLASITPESSAPLLFLNLVNGGDHAQSKLAFQEYHIVPQTERIEEALEIAFIVQRALKIALVKEFGSLSGNIGDEGGFVPDTANVQKPLEVLSQVIQDCHVVDMVKLSLDVAASSFYKDGVYYIEGKEYTAIELKELYKQLTADFALLSIEDPFNQEDFVSFAALTKETDLGVVGDDLTVTNVERIQQAIAQESMTSVIIKPNQVGTLTETLEAMKLARDNKIHCIVSHRSGETADDFISDLAMAFGCYGIKAGALQRGERVQKYNRLWQIQQQLL